MRSSWEAVGSTDPSLLEKIRKWDHFDAWLRFLEQYDSCVIAECRFYGLTGDQLDECRQHLWIQLAKRMREFRYDPSGRFRAWLRQFLAWRIGDFLRSEKGVRLAERLERLPFDVAMAADDAICDPIVLAMLNEAEEIQAAVKRRVTVENWEAWWLIAVEGWSIDETRERQNRKYAAVFRAHERVSRMIEEERDRSAESGDALKRCI